MAVRPGVQLRERGPVRGQEVRLRLGAQDGLAEVVGELLVGADRARAGAVDRDLLGPKPQVDSGRIDDQGAEAVADDGDGRVTWRLRGHGARRYTLRHGSGDGLRRLPHRRGGRPRRHGRGLPGQPDRPGPPRGPQAADPCAGLRPRIPGPVPAGVAPGREHRPPQRGRRLRGGRGRRPALHHDALGRGLGPAPGDREPRAAGPGPRGRDHRPGRRRARRRPRHGAGPPRRQAGEHPARRAPRARARLPDRLRPDQAGGERRRPDPDGPVGGHARLHRPRADPRRKGRRALGRLRAGRRARARAHRPRAVRARLRRGEDVGPHQRRRRPRPRPSCRA